MKLEPQIYLNVHDQSNNQQKNNTSSPQRKTQKTPQVNPPKVLPDEETDITVEEGKDTKGQDNIALKEYTNPPDLTEKKVNLLIEKSQQVLLKIKGTFPFQFFPSEVTIDETKTTIKHNQFFGSGYTETILNNDIEDVTVEMSPFSATLELKLQRKPQPLKVFNLNKEGAIKAKRILLGMLILRREKIDSHKIPHEKLTQHLLELGAAE